MKRNVELTAVLAFLIIIFVSSASIAQDCKYFYPTKVGATLEYTTYNHRGKEDSKQIHKVLEQKQKNGATVLVIEATKTDKKNEKAVKTTFEVSCDEGNFYTLMDDFTSAFNYKQYQDQPDMAVEISSDGLFYPSDLAIGQSLPDGSVQIDIMSDGVNMFGTTVTVKNRKVESADTLNTPAGTFICLKVSADVVTQSFATIETKTIQWLSEGVGVVKSENYNKEGTLASYRLLTKIEK